MSTVEEIKKSYRKSCPMCKHQYVEEIDDGGFLYIKGKRHWVHFCEMDDNLHSEEIFFCPYCGFRLPQ